MREHVTRALYLCVHNRTLVSAFGGVDASKDPEPNQTTANSFSKNVKILSASYATSLQHVNAFSDLLDAQERLDSLTLIYWIPICVSSCSILLSGEFGSVGA
jgi:hypothetical protein